MSLFRKPRKNFRKKVEIHESDEDENDANNGKSDSNLTPLITPEDSEASNDATISLSKVKKKKEKKNDISTNVPKTLLSFGHDEEESTEVFKVKKSSHSRRVYKQMKRDKKREKEEENKIKEIKKKESAKEKHNEKSDDSEDMEVNGEDMLSEFSDPTDEDEKKAQHPFKSVLERGEIPDANLIHMARKRRQMAREMGDFIPVDDTEKLDNGSRLIREEDNDLSDDEEGRITMALNKTERERQALKDNFLAAEHGSDESDREREWEEQQIRKAVSAVQIQEQQQQQQSTYNYGYGQYNRYGDNFMSHYAIPSGPPPPPPSEPPPLDSSMKPLVLSSKDKPLLIDDVKRSLKNRLDELKQVNRAHTIERDKLTTDLIDSRDAIAECEGKKSNLEEQYKFFQETRGYVRDLVECMNEKVPSINALDVSMLNLWKQRSEYLIKRRQDDIRDQSEDYALSKSVPKAVITEAKQRRAAEREARRARRRRARIDRNYVDHHEGMSSDDEESQSETIKFRNESERIRSEKNALFVDVLDEFSTFAHIKTHFEKWKHGYHESYSDAYIGLCLPKLFTPLIKAQLITWNPLEQNTEHIEKSSWFRSLMLYGFMRGIKPDPDDQDLKLIPSIVEKLIIPKITVMIEGVWDPMSTSQTTAVVTLMRQLCEDYPTVNADNKNTQLFLQAVMKRMRKTLDDDVFMPLYPKAALENRSSGAYIFLQRQFWSCIKLIGNILSWHGIISDKTIQELALNGVLNRYVLLGLQCTEMNHELIEKCQVIMKKFPKQWFENIEGDTTIPLLQSFCRFLVNTAVTLDKNTKEKKDLERKEARDNIKQITKILVNIRAMDHAINVSSQTSIKVKS